MRRKRKRKIQDDSSSIGYARVSTYEQAMGGISIETQIDSIQKYCSLKNLKLVDMITDPGTSAGIQLSDRLGGKQLLEKLINKKATSIIAVKLDRLFRDVVDCLTTMESWDKKDTNLHVIDFSGQAINTKGATGKFLLTVLAGVAELEKNRIKERTSEAMQMMKRMGIYTGGKILYGFRTNKNKELEPYEPEQQIVETIINARNESISIPNIIRLLDDLGYLSRSGKQFSRTQIEKIIDNYEYTEVARKRRSV